LKIITRPKHMGARKETEFPVADRFFDSDRRLGNFHGLFE
jgi:hypothetical protein